MALDRPRLAVLDYGIGNLRSAQKSLEKVGADAVLTSDPAVVADAHGVVLPGVEGLGLLPGEVVRLPAGVKHPQMQWNRLDLVRPDDPLVAGLPEESWMYFVHSFHAAVDPELLVATCDYGGTVTAIAGRGQVWACQMHPEKSARHGLQLLADFVELTAGRPVGAAA